MNLRIGSHPDNLSLFVLRQRGELETHAKLKGWRIHWADYQHGGASADLLADNQLDVVGTGSTSAIYARAGGLDVLCLGASPGRTAHCALLVMKQSGWSSALKIAGARIACMKGAFSDRFIAQLLIQSGLTLKDITLVNLSGSDSARALREGKVDIWAAIDPWLSVAREAKKVRALGETGDYINERSLFWCLADWQQRYPSQARWIQHMLAENDVWIAQHPYQAADLIHRHLPVSVSVQDWLTTICSRSWGIAPVSARVLDEQQQQADDLFASGFLSQPLCFSATQYSEAPM